jgi:RHS repeat-associated protein
VNLKVSAVTTGGYTGLTTLSTGSLPTGVTASFAPPSLGPNMSGLVTLTTSGSTPSSSSIEVRGIATIEGVAVTRTGTTLLNVQAAGQTVLAGQVLDENEKPISGVSIKLGGSAITTLGTTDPAGNFLVSLSVAGPQVFLIDGSSASTSTLSYPTIPVTLNIQAGMVNSLGFVPHLHSQPTAKLIPITPGQETVLTDPDLPGFRMTIPAGVSIIGWDGQANTQVSVKAIPIDRSPIPPPPPGQSSRVVYLFYFGKVGGGLPTGNIPVDTPNDVGGLPGDKVDLYYFNEAPDGTAPNQWEKYGTGTVSSDGTRILTDINPATGQPYGIPRFCCGGLRNVPVPTPSAGGGPPGGPVDSGKKDGEPVDTATGFFYLTKGDMVLPGIIPLTVTRTYRTNLTNAGPFGLGTSWDYDLFLLPPPNGSPDALLLFSPGNRQDLFARQPDGSFINPTSPALRGAVITVAGGLRTLRFKDGSTWQFRTSDGLLVSQADRNGNTVFITRDGQGRVTALTEPRGRQLTFSYTGTTLRIDRITDRLGRSVQYTYDAQGRLTSVTDAAGGITQYTYDGNHRLLTITDPRGITFLTNEYDNAGRVIRQTQADGGIWIFAYTTSGSFISQTVVTDPRSNPTTYRFNSAGYLIQQTDALGQTTTFERQPSTNLFLSTTDPLGRVTRFTYDANGNVTAITDPLGNTRTFTYDPTFNKVTSITDPLGDLTTFEYDAQGNLTAITDPEQNLKPPAERLKTTFTYNEAGQPLTTTDPLGNTTSFEYDSTGNVSRIIDPLGNATTRAYDLVSRLITQSDPLGKTTRFSYDALNRLVSTLDALNGQTTFGYDPNGNLLSVTDARGNTITHEYDSMDRLNRRIDQLGKAETFSYDGNGNLVSTTDRKLQTTTFTYDPLNRRTQAGYADGAVATFIYDAAGRLLQADDTADPHRPISMAYDSLDRLFAETTSLGTVSYQYDALGRRTQMTVSGQSPVTYTYDAASRLRTITQAPLNPVDIQYDAVGRRTSLALPNQVSTEYQYDAASRLTALIYRNALGTLGDLQYTYDPAGSRTAVGGSFARTLLPDSVPSATYDSANRQLAFGALTMTFDDNGNLLTQTEPSGTTTNTWDARNRLAGIAGSSMNASFAYDGVSRRARKVSSGISTDFLYDGLDIVKETGGAGDASYLRTLAIDEALTRTDAVDTVHYLADALGSTMALTTATGVSVTTYTYEPFGRTQASGSASGNLFQFTGRENDAPGFYHYRARYYRPSAGRFMSEDPIGSAGGSLNLYSYARSNPFRFTDPTGLKLWIYVTASVGGGAAVGGEYGKYYLIDPSSGEAHQFEYLGGGPSLGAAGGGTLQGGIFDGPDDPKQLSGLGLEVNAFAAAGKGVAGQTSGTSWFGSGEAGVAAGVAAGAGASISGLVTYSWYGGKAKYLPESVEKLVKELGTRIRPKK